MQNHVAGEISVGHWIDNRFRPTDHLPDVRGAGIGRRILPGQEVEPKTEDRAIRHLKVQTNGIGETNQIRGC